MHLEESEHAVRCDRTTKAQLHQLGLVMQQALDEDLVGHCDLTHVGRRTNVAQLDASQGRREEISRLEFRDVRLDLLQRMKKITVY